VILDHSITELVDLVDTNSVRVHAPSPILFLCGGKTNVTAAHPSSLREAFTRVFYGRPKFERYAMLMAEDVNVFFPRGNYKDILRFEADIAQISDLIVLFSESFGSAAELGAFSMVEEIALRLLVVIDDKHYGDVSFITLGPIRSLENNQGDTSICVLNRADINIHSIENVSNVNLATFGDRVETAINNRKATNREHSRFNKNREGHIIKLITGLIQYYGALTIDEIQLFIERFGCVVSLEILQNFLLCSEFAKWTVRIKGVSTYYCDVGSGNEALQFSAKASFQPFDKLRWRADVSSYWQRADADRYSVIQRARRGETT